MTQNTAAAVLSQRERNRNRSVKKTETPIVYKVDLLYRAGGHYVEGTRQRLNSIEILGLEGQIINGQTETLRSAVQLASGASDIILDFSNVSLVDAHGLGVLLQLREQTIASGMRFELMNVNTNLSRVFEITRLNTVFQINSGVKFFPRPVYAPRLFVAA